MGRGPSSMGTVRPYKKGRFLASFYHNYRQYRHVVKTRAEARDWISATITTLEHNARPVTQSDMIAAGAAKAELPPGVTLADCVAHYLRTHRKTGLTIEQAADAFLADKRKAGLRPGSQRNLHWHMTRLKSKLGAAPINSVDRDAITAALDALHPESTPARNDTRGAWLNFWNWAIKAGLAEKNPLSAISKLRIDERTPGILTPPQITALLAAAVHGKAFQRKMVPYLAIGFFAGLRTAEIARLTWEDIDLTAGHIHITGAAAKMRHRRYATITPTLRAWLEPYQKRTGPLIRVKERARIMCLVSIRTAAKVPFVRNAMRHSFASYHLAMHQDATKTAFELGHARPDLLYRHYRNLVTKTDAEAFWNLTPKNIPPPEQQRPTKPKSQPQQPEQAA